MGEGTRAPWGLRKVLGVDTGRPPCYVAPVVWSLSVDLPGPVTTVWSRARMCDDPRGRRRESTGGHPGSKGPKGPNPDPVLGGGRDGVLPKKGTGVGFRY